MLRGNPLVMRSADESGERAKIESGLRPKSDSDIPRIYDDDITEVTSTTRLMPSSRRTHTRPRLTVMTGVSAGAVLPLDHKYQFFLGRSRSADLRLDDQGVSRVHCRIARKGDELWVEDLGSTNGTRLNGEVVASAQLNAGDRIQIGPNAVLQLAFFDDTEEDLQRRLFEASTRDPLTRAFNRRFFFQRLEGELSYARRHGTSVAVLMLDLDHFKRINDSAGHQAGDAVLCAAADEIGRTVRSEDVFARYGGEEFTVLARVGSREEASLFAERLRMKIENLRIPDAGKVLRVTVSVGVAVIEEIAANGTAEELVSRADMRLYRAKVLGRNRVASE